MVCNTRDLLNFEICQSSNILKNTTIHKLNLFQRAGGYLLCSVRQKELISVTGRLRLIKVSLFQTGYLPPEDGNKAFLYNVDYGQAQKNQ